MRKKKWDWMDNETGEFLTSSEQEGDDSRNPRCPKCGGKTEFIEGTYDQDYQGNDIRGWWFDCHVCNIGTPPFEGDYNGDEE